MWLRKCSGPKSCTSVCHMIESLSTFWIATCLNGLVSSIFRRPISVGSVCPYILVELVLLQAAPLSRYSQIPLPKCIHHQWFMDHWIGVTEDLFTLEVLSEWITLLPERHSFHNITEFCGGHITVADVREVFLVILSFGSFEFLHSSADSYCWPGHQDWNDHFSNRAHIGAWNNFLMNCISR